MTQGDGDRSHHLRLTQSSMFLLLFLQALFCPVLGRSCANMIHCTFLGAYSCPPPGVPNFNPSLPPYRKKSAGLSSVAPPIELVTSPYLLLDVDSSPRHR